MTALRPELMLHQQLVSTKNTQHAGHCGAVETATPNEKCRISDSEVRGTLEAMRAQLKAQQDMCTAQVLALQEKLEQHQVAAEAAASAAASKHSELQKSMQRATSSAHIEAEAKFEAMEKGVQVC
jgi:hypothetical protein